MRNEAVRKQRLVQQSLKVLHELQDKSTWVGWLSKQVAGSFVSNFNLKIEQVMLVVNIGDDDFSLKVDLGSIEVTPLHQRLRTRTNSHLYMFVVFKLSRGSGARGLLSSAETGGSLRISGRTRFRRSKIIPHFG